ncbi:acetyl esterase [Xaviernesmea oryzae]|uniref:Acetyl esterase n=2 Tax=Xaviernesmea oryzae TaxID=464029 RepID=A0A1X7DXS4_9HYPH|nr:acetyl esterase [Xaviernesmea oryzae]
MEAEHGPSPDPTLLGVAEGRALSEELNRRWNVDLPEVQIRRDIWLDADEEIGSARTRLRVLLPANASPGAVVFVHGGGFAFGGPEMQDRLSRVLAVESKMPVLVPDYRLAPENPYPCGLQDVVACVRHGMKAAIDLGVKSGPLILCGESAGANLGLAAMLNEHLHSMLMPVGAVFFSGNFGLDTSTPSYEQFADGPGLTRARMQRFLRWYVGDRDLSSDPLASPLAASDEMLSALPPIHLFAAGIDPLQSDSLMLAERLARLGRPCDLVIVPGVTHAFTQYSAFLQKTRDVLRSAGSIMRRMAAVPPAR